MSRLFSPVPGRAAAPRPETGPSIISSYRPRSPLFCLVAVLAAVSAAGACAPGDDDSRSADRESAVSEASVASVRPGLEVLLADSLHLVAGRRVGLVTNHTGVDRAGTSSIDLLARHPEVELVALYAPEHSIRGDVGAGVTVATELDGPSGVPIHSLYGDVRRPTEEMLEGVDVLLFDMQDVGARYYTYPSTMALAMDAAGEHGIPFVVLDRPNPIRGDVVQGNVLDPAFATFVGMYPVPMRHGMTVGELARLYVGEFGIDAELHVVPAEGWSRSSAYDETGLAWLPPSPNMPSLESALAYPGTCLFEGTPLSVGRGTDLAFQWVGAPWLEADALASALGRYGFEGVSFVPATFTPTAPGDGKFDGVEVHGVRLVAESTTYDAPRVAVAMLLEAYAASEGRWEWLTAHFDRLAGTDALRLGIEAGLGLDELTEGWGPAAGAFARRREPYLVY